MSSLARAQTIRGVFLDKVEIRLPRPEIMVNMQFATKQERKDSETNVVTERLVESRQISALSSDNGNTFRVRPLSDIDGDGDIDEHDRAKLAALAKAYCAIVNP
jgi:hypothetical protein